MARPTVKHLTLFKNGGRQFKLADVIDKQADLGTGLAVADQARTHVALAGCGGILAGQVKIVHALTNQIKIIAVNFKYHGIIEISCSCIQLHCF